MATFLVLIPWQLSIAILDDIITISPRFRGTVWWEKRVSLAILPQSQDDGIGDLTFKKRLPILSLYKNSAAIMSIHLLAAALENALKSPKIDNYKSTAIYRCYVVVR